MLLAEASKKELNWVDVLFYDLEMKLYSRISTL